MARLVIFDFDGTLADTAEWFVEAINSAASLFGYRCIGPEDLNTLRGIPTRDILKELDVPLWRLPALARHLRAEAGANLHRMKLFRGAEQCLRLLHEAGIKIAIVSSNSEATIRSVLGERNSVCVAHFACGASLFGKTAKLEGALRALGIPAVDALAVGDESRDIEAAKASGVFAAAVTWGYATRAALLSAEPDLIFDTFDELVAKILDGHPPEGAEPLAPAGLARAPRGA